MLAVFDSVAFAVDCVVSRTVIHVYLVISGLCFVLFFELGCQNHECAIHPAMTLCVLTGR